MNRNVPSSSTCSARSSNAVEPSGAYDEATRVALSAFQRRFRPERVDGVADAETSALVQQVALDYYMS